MSNDDFETFEVIEALHKVGSTIVCSNTCVYDTFEEAILRYEEAVCGCQKRTLSFIEHYNKTDEFYANVKLRKSNTARILFESEFKIDRMG